MWSTLVPTWNRRKGLRRESLRHLGDWVHQAWGYGALMSMGTTKRRNAGERSPWSDAVGAQVDAERSRRGWSQVELARRSGVGRATILRIEAGTRVADTTQIARMCGAFEMPISEFFRRVEQQNPEAALAARTHQR